MAFADTLLEALGSIYEAKADKELLKKAEELGKKAFESGMEASPALDKEMMQLIKGMKVGESTPYLKAWSKGWHKANAR